ncbi:MAG: S8 family serine peptidase [Micromonosporaceae bacterium]
MTAGLVAFLLAAVGVGPAEAAATPADREGSTAAGRDPTTGGHGTTATVGGGTRVVDLTLVTGDTVHIAVDADGRQTATVTPAPRPDGSLPGFWTHRRGDDLYVVPHDVAPLIPTRLDPALFNVSALMELGYADADSDSLPVIVTFPSRARPTADLRARSLSGDGGPVRHLESVNGLGLRIDKAEDTAAVRQALHREAAGARARRSTPGPLDGFGKIWLDRPVRAALADSTAQIGAPAAWRLGHDGSGVTVAVLDTGIDADHPDLAGKVVASRNFSASDTTDDRYGHGTHVASIIAGSGAASGGRYRGVAPGVSLINAKVLDDFGNGSTSDLIDAMEWAVQQGADIVNMSLGARGSYTDGTDPASLAVNALAEQHGTLFVISAGNDGPGDSTVTTPGTADRALTVGAVDRDDRIAGFSSRGPRAGDVALKPDLTAPGVGIVAARAGGTAMGQPVDDHYTAESGTSMSAPHVTGAAALVADARPGLDGAQIKALLMGTAVPQEDLGAFAQGAGRVDVAAALDSPVVAAPPSVSYGYFGFPHDHRDPVTRTVTYTNLSEQPQTLTLEVDARREDTGEPAPEGALTLSTGTLTVPPGGTASVTLTLDTRRPGAGRYSGALVARTADGATVRTPVGYEKEPEMYELRVEGIARDGRPALGRFRVLDVVDGSVAAFRSWGAGSDTSCTTDAWAASNCVRVPPGIYSVSGFVFTMPHWAPSTEEPGQFGAYLNTTLVAEPEVVVDGPTTLTLDAREAVEVRIETPDHRTARNVGAARQINFYREPERGPAVSDGFLLTPWAQIEERLFLQPTDEVTHGRLAAYTQWQLEAPAITFEVVGAEGVELEPLYYDPHWFSGNSWQFPVLEGHLRLPVVDAGTATPAEIAGLDLEGALALVRRSDAIPVAEQSNNAAAAGARLVAVYNDLPGSNSDPGGTGVLLQVPTVRLSHAEGEQLRHLLAQGPVVVDAHGQPASPYRYNLTLVEQGRIPPDLHYVADADQLAAVENRFHSQVSDQLTYTESWFAQQPWETFSLSFPMPGRGAPGVRTDYYVPGGGIRYDQRITTPETPYNYLWPLPEQDHMHFQSGSRTFQPGERVQRSWLRAPLRPGLWPEDPVRRTGDTITFRLAAFTDGDGHVAEASSSWFEGGFTTRLRVAADGQLLWDGDLASGSVEVPAGSRDVRIEYEVDNASPWAQLSGRTRAVWTFTSPRPPDGQTVVVPMLTVDYDVDVDLRNRAPSPPERRGPHTIVLTIGHQDGAATVPVDTASLAVSYDSGRSWRPVPNLREVSEGRFVANLPAVAPTGGDGFISLRVRAEDRAGNTVEQEIIRAYAMSPR